MTTPLGRHLRTLAQPRSFFKASGNLGPVAVWTEIDAVLRDHILVRCPRCSERATIDCRSGFERLTCPACGLVKEIQPRSASSKEFNARSALEVYNSGNTLFGAPLWLETECCGGNRLWALNETHLDSFSAFVGSTDRTGEFPSPAGYRQPADKLPKWMVEAKHRDEVLRTPDRLRKTL
jgi:hypothetical protein